MIFNCVQKYVQHNLCGAYSKKLVYESNMFVQPNLALLQSIKIYSCSRTPIFVATVRFCNFLCSTCCSDETNNLVNSYAGEII